MIRKKIGELAVEKDWITSQERDTLLKLQKQKRILGEKEGKTLFGQLLVEQGVCSETMISDLLSQQNTSTEFLFYSLKSRGDSFQFGDYFIEKLIAQGGMGDVYKAKTPENTHVALKTINWKNYNNKLKKRFLREIRTLIELNHPHIVNVYDYGQINGIDFLVMEYLKGSTLNEAMYQKNYSYKIWLQKFLGLLDAIESIHQKNIIHRDLKPSNIILSENENLILIDFGLSKNIDQENYSSLFTTHPVGTPAYMSPEQIFSEENLDYRTDIWSLGVIIFQLLTKKLPFADKNIQRLMHAIQYKQVDLFAQSDVNLPKEIQWISYHALEKNKHKRYQSVRDMHNDIKDFLRGAPLVHLEEVYEKEVKYESHANATIHNRYHILEKLGKGGMGTVYLAYDLIKQKHIALKVLHSYLLQNEHFKKRFLLEARHAVMFSHKHALPIYDFGQSTKGLYFVMKLCKGKTLKTLIQKKGKLSEHHAISILKQILQALKEGHEKSMIHMNLKPSNIMIDYSTGKEVALILDMGIAKISVNPDSVYYMSPEQVGGDEVDQQTDIYSTGVIFYEMLTGHLPFEGESLMDIFTKIISQEHYCIKKANPTISKKVVEIINRSLAKNRKKRFINVDAFLQELETCN